MMLTEENTDNTVLPDPIDSIGPATKPVAADIKNKAVSGIKVLGMRTVISIILRVVSSVTVARILVAHDFGVFAVLSYITGISMYLCDVGLASTLIRKESVPSKDELYTVFISQQVITAVVVTAVILSGPHLVKAYNLTSGDMIILNSMALSLFLSSLRIVPMLALERELRYSTIAKCEMIENFVQTFSTIGLALMHFGPWALAGGNILRSIVGLTCVFIASPWTPSGRFKPKIFTGLAKFGVAFQLSAIIPTLANGWMPLIVGRLLGVASVGYVGWATNIASVPMMFSGIISRISFPAYSRLQSDLPAFGRYLSGSIRRISTVYLLIIPVTLIIVPIAVPIIFKSKWIPAIPLVEWFTLECSLLTITGVLASAQNALGFSGKRMSVTIVVAIVRWTVGYLVVSHFGLLGIGPAMFTISLSELLFTSTLVHRELKAHSTLLTDIYNFVFSIGLLIGAPIVIARMVVHREGLERLLIALTVYAILLIFKNAVSKNRDFKEIRMLRAMFSQGAV